MVGSAVGFDKVRVVVYTFLTGNEAANTAEPREERVR